MPELSFLVWLEAGEVSRRKLTAAVVSVFIMQSSLSALAAEVEGSADLGFWLAQNNVSAFSGFQTNDAYGDDYVHKRFMLFNVGLRAKVKDVWARTNGHIRGRGLFRPTDGTYSLGTNDRWRGQIDEFALEINEIAKRTDLWLGRQMIDEVGGASVDGLRFLYHFTEQESVGVYGGFSNDPRNLTGYIGPSYERNPFSLRHRAAGFYYDLKGEKLRADAGIHAALFKGGLDRLSLLTQASYALDSVWTFGTLVHFGIAGDSGLKATQAVITSRPTNRVTNTFSFSRYVTWVFDKSNASAIPVPSSLLSNTSLIGVVGSDVRTASYNTLRNHVMVRIFDRNYLFGALQFSRRTFDGENQWKYTAGYRDPHLFGTSFDLRFQTDVFDNYRGFTTLFDAMLGREFLEGRFRMEAGGSFSATERDRLLNNVIVAPQAEGEKESALRFNVYYVAKNRVNWTLSYALYQERDVLNNDVRVRTHEVYLANNIRF